MSLKTRLAAARKRLADKHKRDRALHKDIAHNKAVITGLKKKVAAKQRPTGVSAEGVALIARFEGFVGHVYRDAVGVETIGYGETRRDIIEQHRHSGISEADARALLRRRVDANYAPPVLALNLPTQNAIDATVSLVYNCGPGCIAAGTTIGNALRAKRWRAAADGFLLWDKAGGQRLPGLTRRRQEERALFLKGL
jgi:lysozyme